MSQASIGWGSSFELFNGTALTAIAEATSIGFPEYTADEIEVTHLLSPGRIREFISGLTDAGELAVEMNYIPGSPTDLMLQAAQKQGNTRAWKIVVSDAAGEPAWEADGTGFVKSYSRDALEVDSVKKATVVIRVSGDVTEAAAA